MARGDQHRGQLKRVRLGSLNLFNTTDDEHVQEFNVTHIFRHPNYTQPVLYNDIALVMLDRSVEITEYVRPACLATDAYAPNTNLIATGWGRTQYLNPRSETLMKVSLDLFSIALCKQAYVSVPTRQLPNGISEDLQICAGDANKEKDACQGDSGGPLQIVDQYNPALYYIIGITSFGRSCGTTSNPGVYTRVSHYVGWIEEIVWPNEK
ncbi:hypothetical protein ILUMI_12053 [Ignelater luminosus]|uniref:Peptidase S1 domain-containing protein n=1 Tax=Ignelater luminosus TaxID=2038154 RepID=A0A8K0GC60_IGNLU|nr:hypothetical protein ILUMI_12053 [Ignelater luminosus]